MPHEHLYGRVSDPQSESESIERQTAKEKAEAFGKMHGFILHRKFWIDDGVSAFYGLNATPNHELGKFIHAAMRGRGIKEGDCLLIENYDRLSRQNPWAAIALVNDLRNLKIHVGRLDTMRLLRYDSEDIGDFFECAAEFSRSHSESKAKQYRLLSIRKKEREERRAGQKCKGGRLPAWLRITNGEVEVIPERKAAVLLILQKSANGCGIGKIIKLLAQGGYEPFEYVPNKERGKKRMGRYWTASYIYRLLHDRRLLGEYQPCRRVRRTGRKAEPVPDGGPILGYYPQVVEEEALRAAQKGLRKRRGRAGRPGEREINLFAGLLQNPQDGGTWFCRSRKHNRPILINTLSVDVRAPYRSFPYDHFETELLRHLREVPVDSLLGDGDDTKHSVRLAADLSAVREELKEINDYLAKHRFLATLGRRIDDLELREADLAEQLELAEETEAHPFLQAWSEQQSLLRAWQTRGHEEDFALRTKALFQETIQTVCLAVFSPKKHTRIAFVQIWFAREGQQRSYVIYHQSALRHRPEKCWSESFGDIRLPGSSFDLRRQEDFGNLSCLLEEISRSLSCKGEGSP